MLFIIHYTITYDFRERRDPFVVFKEIPAGRLADFVMTQLKEAIFQGQYQPGERLPSENKLVEIFGISRTVVREAIRNLETSGMVRIKRGPMGGAFVLPMSHESVTPIVRDALRLAKAKVADIMEVRLDIEPVVATLAARRRTEKDIEVLSQELEAVPEAPGDAYVAWNVRFHRLVARASHNPMYEILVNILLDFTEELVLKIKPPELVVHDTVSHPAVFEKIKKGDAEGAGRLYRKHLLDITPMLQKLEENLPKKFFH
jgi:GntR family transcriptional repressor for pyruvate dehydrogenase complex